MRLDHGLHLAYCTNVHPGRDWTQTFDSLNRYTLAIKRQLEHPGPFAVGLRLGDGAARELSEPPRLLEFQRWLEKNECYVFTINGFPYGNFHGARVKEDVYRPDWTEASRVEYTNCLFDLLAELVPQGVAGSVSTLPGSFKEFIHSPAQEQLVRNHVWRCVEHIARTCEKTGRSLHLGLEPEPLCQFENSEESIRFFEQLRAEHPGDERLNEHLGINYDACHFAVEFEQPGEALKRFQEHGIKISKIHISNALRLRPTPGSLQQLTAFSEDVYLHQVIVRRQDGTLIRFKDLDLALSSPLAAQPGAEDEWRVHFHIPLHSQPPGDFESTADHVLGVFKVLGANPALCSHLEMETYTWAVLPEALKSRNVCDQIVAEYHWTLQHLGENGLASGHEKTQSGSSPAVLLQSEKAGTRRS